MDRMTQTFPQVATGAVVFKDGCVLLVKRRNPPSKGLWAIPGGRVLPGESLSDSVRRELLEETGISVSVGDVVYVFDVIERDAKGRITLHYIIIDYMAGYISGVPTPGDDAAEVRWVSKDEMKDMPVNASTRKLLKEKFAFP